MTAKYPQCHMLKGHSLNRCTAESVNPNPDVGPMLCSRHIAQVVEFLKERAILTTTPSRRKS